ncbi:MAG TPA: FlgD immunoglobulin-like domain containing protein [Candidatus Krumholzibacteria bacterium]|nr:FlgD immunoglobulin-like domain containing protein [Candidatus Krumholzibacteria bacterium]
MRPLTLTCLLSAATLFASTPVNAAPVYDWGNRIGGQGVNNAYGVAVDGSGNVVVAGTFTGSMNLGGGTLTSAGSYDVFLAKYDANGAFQWSQRFGGTGLDGARAVAFDGAGNIVMTGYFGGSVSFGGAPLTGGAHDIFVAKFDGSGAHQWSHYYGGAGIDEGMDVAVDASGNVLIAGQYVGAVDFGGGPVSAFGGLDAFVLKLDAAGVYQWTRCAGSINPDVARGVAVDASGNVFLTGSFSGSIDPGSGPLTSAGSTDAFLAKYAADGTPQWSARIGGTGADSGQQLGVDASGSVVVTGIYNGAFLAKYDTDGVPQWNQNFASSGLVQGLDVAVRPDGGIVFTGNLQGSTNFGGGMLTSAGNDDIYITRCDASGAHVWSQRFGSTGDDWGYGCTFDNAGNVVAAGIFAASVDFGGGAMTSMGLADGYVVKFDSGETIADTTPPTLTCPGDIQVDAVDASGTPATDPAIAAFLAGAGAIDDTDPAPVIHTDAPAVFPIGTTPVMFTAMDVSGNHSECTSNVTVRDATPPFIGVTLDKTVLWPPDHKFVTVCATVTTSDNSGTEPAFTLVSITSSEPVNGHGDGHTSPDIQNADYGTADRCFDLRAERSGNGDGRIYSIVYSAMDGSGNAVYDTVEVRVPHDMSASTNGAGASQSALLTSVHPNPFNPETTVEYTLLNGGYVDLTIYDAHGAVVRQLVSQTMSAGDHSVMWNGTDRGGNPVSSGIYFVRMTAGSHVDTRKLVLLK